MQHIAVVPLGKMKMLNANILLISSVKEWKLATARLLVPEVGNIHTSLNDNLTYLLERPICATASTTTERSQALNSEPL